MSFIARLFVIVFAALSLGAAPSFAQSLEPNWLNPPARDYQQRARDTNANASVRSVREVAAMVRAQRGGQLVDVLRFDRRANPPAYVLRWRFPNGVVRDLRVNAITGQIMG